jgi:hypothetical protein
MLHNHNRWWRRAFNVCIILLAFTVQGQILAEAPVKVEMQNKGTKCPYTTPVRPAWFYKPPKPYSSTSAAVANFDFFVLTRKDESMLNAVHDAGKSPVLQYLKFDALHDPCFQALKSDRTRCWCNVNPKSNQVGWLPNDICVIRQQHPDWFLRDANGDLLYWNDYVMMDPGNAGWQKFWLSRVQISGADGWDGVFLDNLATQFGVHGSNYSVQLQKYATPVEYRVAVVNFLSTVRAAYFVPGSKQLYANISVRTGDNAVFHQYLQQMDGAMDEFWAVMATDYYGLNGWLDRYTRAEEAVKAGKGMLLVSHGQQHDLNRQMFALASYLLIAGPQTSFRYTSEDGGYSQVWLYDNYKIPLGEPIGYATRKYNIWTRVFTNGTVVVQPGKRLATITLNNACP